MYCLRRSPLRKSFRLTCRDRRTKQAVAKLRRRLRSSIGPHQKRFDRATNCWLGLQRRELRTLILGRLWRIGTMTRIPRSGSWRRSILVWEKVNGSGFLRLAEQKPFARAARRNSPAATRKLTSRPTRVTMRPWPATTRSNKKQLRMHRPAWAIWPRHSSNLWELPRSGIARRRSRSISIRSATARIVGVGSMT